MIDPTFYDNPKSINWTKPGYAISSIGTLICDDEIMIFSGFISRCRMCFLWTYSKIFKILNPIVSI